MYDKPRTDGREFIMKDSKPTYSLLKFMKDVTISLYYTGLLFLQYTENEPCLTGRQGVHSSVSVTKATIAMPLPGQLNTTAGYLCASATVQGNDFTLKIQLSGLWPQHQLCNPSLTEKYK